MRSAIVIGAWAASSSDSVRADHDVVAGAQLDVDLVREGRDRGGGEVVDPEGAGGEADQRRAALGDGRGRRAVAVDGAVDIDAVAADQAAA